MPEYSWQARVDSRSLLAGWGWKKEWSRNHKIGWALFYLPFFPSSCGLFSSESICIYYDSSRFALLWVFLFCFVMKWKRDIISTSWPRLWAFSFVLLPMPETIRSHGTRKHSGLSLSRLTASGKRRNLDPLSVDRVPVKSHEQMRFSVSTIFHLLKCTPSVPYRFQSSPCRGKSPKHS